MLYQSVGDFPVDVMTNQFNLSDWNYNDDSDLYESIDLIKDYTRKYNELPESSQRAPRELFVCKQTIPVWN